MAADRHGSGSDPETPLENGPRSASLPVAFVAAGGIALAASLFLLWNRSWNWSTDASLILLVAGIALVAGPFLSRPQPERPGRAVDDPGIALRFAYAPEPVFEYSEGAELARPTKLPENWSTSWMAAAASPEVADVLWQSWNATPGELPVALVPPVPETAYIETKPGAPLLPEEGEPVALETLIAKEPAYWAARAQASPRVAGPEDALAGSSGPSLAPGAVSSVTSAAPPTVSAALSSPAAVPTLEEALDPTPPHLRRKAPGRHTESPPGHGAAPSARCASCHKWIHDPKFWSRCGDCHSHLCTHCIVESLLEYEWAWCTHCAGLRHMNSLVHELRPDQPKPAPRPLASGRRPRRPLAIQDGGIRPAQWQPMAGMTSGGRSSGPRTRGLLRAPT